MIAAIPRLLLLLVPLAVLTACDKAQAPAAPPDKRAEGEVLGGTISDAMIPLDQLRSQSPPLRVAPNGDDVGGSGDSTRDADEPDQPEPAPDDAPAAAEPAEQG